MDHIAENDEIRVVLLGKTGNGKSSLGNTLIGRDAFRVARGLTSGTEKCQWAETNFHGKNLQVTDTPGLCDTHRSEDEILREISKSLAVASPGPHVLFMVLRCDRRFTKEEYEAFVILKRLFGESICQHMIVVFVAIDEFGQDKERQVASLKDGLARCPKQLVEILDDVKWRYIGVNNKATRAERNFQAEKMFSMVQELVHASKGQHFSCSLTDDVTGVLQQHTKKHMQTRNVPQKVAEKEMKTAIINDEDAEFYNDIFIVVEKAIMTVLGMAVNVAMAIAAEKINGGVCSIM